jgi:hypothetical protein
VALQSAYLEDDIAKAVDLVGQLTSSIPVNVKFSGYPTKLGTCARRSELLDDSGASNSAEHRERARGTFKDIRRPGRAESGRETSGPLLPTSLSIHTNDDESNLGIA